MFSLQLVVTTQNNKGPVVEDCFPKIFSENENEKTNLHFQDLRMRLVD